MAATQTDLGCRTAWPFTINSVDVSTLDAGAAVNVAHTGPDGAKVEFITCETITRPASHDPIIWDHLSTSDSLTNNTACMHFDTIPGGDLTGGVIRVNFWFIEAASGGNRLAHP